jgi:hypothetical protein
MLELSWYTSYEAEHNPEYKRLANKL